MNDYNLKKVLCQLNQWCATNNISVQSVYDECHGMSLQDLVYYLLGVVKEAVNQVVENTDAFHELYEFVHDYFDNLDVQEEINNKLDKMSQDGSLANILSKLINSTMPPLIVSSTSDMTDINRTYILQSNGHIYQYQNNNWIDTGLIFGSTIGNVLTFIGNLSTNSDYNDISVQTIYIDTNPSNKLHAPTTSGSMFVYTVGDLELSRVFNMLLDLQPELCIIDIIIMTRLAVLTYGQNGIQMRD